MTAAEVADKLGFGDLNAVRPRLNELEKMDIVRVIDKRINPHSGINNAVYELKREAEECCIQYWTIRKTAAQRLIANIVEQSFGAATRSQIAEVKPYARNVGKI